MEFPIWTACSAKSGPGKFSLRGRMWFFWLFASVCSEYMYGCENWFQIGEPLYILYIASSDDDALLERGILRILECKDHPYQARHLEGVAMAPAVPWKRPRRVWWMGKVTTGLWDIPLFQHHYRTTHHMKSSIGKVMTGSEASQNGFANSNYSGYEVASQMFCQARYRFSTRLILWDLRCS